MSVDGETAWGFQGGGTAGEPGAVTGSHTLFEQLSFGSVSADLLLRVSLVLIGRLCVPEFCMQSKKTKLTSTFALCTMFLFKPAEDAAGAAVLSNFTLDRLAQLSLLRALVLMRGCQAKPVGADISSAICVPIPTPCLALCSYTGHDVNLPDS